MELVLLERGRRKVLASIQVPVKAGIQIGGGGNVGRIKNLRVIPRGTWVELKFGTPFPGKAAVWISTNPPQGNSEQGLNVVRYAPAVGSPGFSHTKKLYGIEPGTKYYYLIRASSQGGLAANTSGDFKTLRRFAKVSIDKIHVIDDSDELSEGELSFSFHLNGGQGKPGGASLVGPGGGTDHDSIEIDSGRSFPVNKVFEVETSALSVKLNSTGYDEDGFETQGVAFKGPACRFDQPFEGSHSDAACDRAGSTKTFTGLGPQAPGVETFKVADFQHSVLGSPLRFRVHGRLWVYYK
jgi:hypothetical protein